MRNRNGFECKYYSSELITGKTGRGLKRWDKEEKEIHEEELSNKLSFWTTKAQSCQGSMEDSVEYLSKLS